MSEDCTGSHGIVIDNGSFLIRAGYVGDDAPRTRFKNLVSTYGYPKDQGNVSFWIYDVPGNLSRSTKRFHYRPIDRGVISNWDDMERIWRYTFMNDLRVDPADHPVLLTESPINPKAKRERMAKIMFETFGVPALHVSTRSLLALFASGRTTGCVVHSGYSVTNVVPIYEGHLLHHAVVYLDLGGRDLDQKLKKLVYERGVAPFGSMHEDIEQELIEDMKRLYCFVSLDFEDDIRKSTLSSDFEKDYELPDGSVLSLGSERFRCPEALFQPKQMGMEFDGIATSTIQAMEGCSDDIDVKKVLYSNIVLSGGSTRFRRFNERLTKEINTHLAVADPSFQIAEIPASRLENTHYSWMGGSVLASLPEFQLHMWITSEEYKECGPSIIHQERLKPDLTADHMTQFFSTLGAF